MKRSLSFTLSAVLALAFLVVTSLAIVCSYHHGIDGLDQRQQSASHSTLFCPMFSKVSGLSLIIASGPGGFTFAELRGEIIRSIDLVSSSFVQDHLARSPPSTILS